MKKSWTAKSHLPGGEFGVHSFESIVKAISKKYSFLDKNMVRRLVRLYGTETHILLKNKTKETDQGTCR